MLASQTNQDNFFEKNKSKLLTSRKNTVQILGFMYRYSVMMSGTLCNMHYDAICAA